MFPRGRVAGAGGQRAGSARRQPPLERSAFLCDFGRTGQSGALAGIGEGMFEAVVGGAFVQANADRPVNLLVGGARRLRANTSRAPAGFADASPGLCIPSDRDRLQP
jgi:hypothetical protein